MAAIYGANASGKSNLLDALTWMRQAVLDSFASWTPSGGVPRVPFKLDPAASAESSGYAVDLILGGVRHYYGFVVDDNMVREEWLHTFPKGRRRVIFEREGADWTFGSTVRGPLDAARDLTRANALFLSVAARSNITECESLFRWFDKGLVCAEPGPTISADVHRALAANSPRRDVILDLLRVADLGITNVELMDDVLESLFGGAIVQHRVSETLRADQDEPEIAERYEVISHPTVSGKSVNLSSAWARAQRSSSRLLFYHGDHPVPLTAAEESAGTRTWLNLTVAIAGALDGPTVLLLDEADTTLHPHLARHLVNLFRSPQINPLGAQLIFTSHDATMLDEDTLSRDEIWFVEKDPSAQTTRLYSLAEFRPRKHENTERRYLAGSYGAVPVLSEFASRRALARGTDPDAA
ncbi:AAA family ATPase [Virgisporangium aurantiacum]|uniref:AAA family ATPase n=1 Tax=Virgisporangium aurantiacum TaxID=175570 RepID=UPI001950FC4B|nr:ATP-binding protein [Virgisporangium aurantiacum]